MKQLKYYLMIMSAVFALGSCSDDDGSPVANNGTDAEISLSADTVQVHCRQTPFRWQKREAILP